MRRHAKLIVALTAASALVGAASAASAQPDPGTPGDPSGDGVVPEVVAGNPTCSQLNPEAGWSELKLDDLDQRTDDTITDSDGMLEVTIVISDSPKGEVFDWESNITVDAVFVKGGPGGNSYLYEPEDDEDTGLHAPVNSNNDKFFDLSHVSFCYDKDDETTTTTTTVPDDTTTTTVPDETTTTTVPDETTTTTTPPSSVAPPPAPPAAPVPAQPNFVG